ncbi:MAG: hypothetical protein ACMUIG_01410 [Thermoplasmatota archaeon]
MVRIGKCTSCGHYQNEIWKDFTDEQKCPECGESVVIEEIEMGTMEPLPKVFKYGGIVLLLLAVIFVLFNRFGDGTRTSGILAVVVLVITVIFFAASIGLQYYLSFTAVKLDEERSRARPSRKVKGRRDHGPRPVKKGISGSGSEDLKRKDGIPPRKGTKIPVGSKWGRK